MRVGVYEGLNVGEAVHRVGDGGHEVVWTVQLSRIRDETHLGLLLRVEMAEDPPHLFPTGWKKAGSTGARAGAGIVDVDQTHGHLPRREFIVLRYHLQAYATQKVGVFWTRERRLVNVTGT